MGCTSPAPRVSGTFPFAAPSLCCSAPSTELQPQFHQGAGSCRRSVRFGGEGGHRDCASFPGLFQPSLCDPQGHRWVASGDRPLTPQRLGGCLPLPHGDYLNRSPISQGGGLDGIPGSPECLLPGSSAYIFSAVPEFLRGRVGLPVSCSMLRSVDGSPSVHTRHGSCLLDHALSVHHGFRILRYLDDWLVLGSSFREIVWARDFLLWLCLHLGIMINASKSSLDPSQTRDYLGMTISTSPLRVFPTLKRVQKLSLLLQEFRSECQHPVSVWRRLLGVMLSSMSAIVPGSRLRMPSLQLRLNASGPFLLEEDLVSWDDGCLPDLRWWSEESHLLVGLLLGEDRPDLFLYSDASDAGWGAALGDLHLSGLWSPLCSRFSINHRELLAVLYAVQGFLPSLRGRLVAVYSDNSTALAYLREQGGTRSSTLNAVAQELLRLCEFHSIRLLPQFIPGHLKVLADSLRRRSQVLGSE